MVLQSAAKDWLYYLPSGSITTWTEMKRIFLEKYFPASRDANIRKKIYGIKQYSGESLHEYWERNMLDASSGGVFVDKTPVQARNLIENMAANSQQFGTVKSDPTPGRNTEVCGICTARGHSTDMCPTLQEGSTEQVNAAGGFPGPPQRKYDPYSNTYNPGWKDHPNLRYGNPQAIQAPPHNPAYRPLYPQKSQHPQETRASIQKLNTQMGQLATAVNMLEALNSNSLPSQTVVNPRENVSAITLRSGKELKVNEEVVKEPVQNKDEQESKVEEDDTIQEAPRGKFSPFSEYKPVAPFPLALKESRKDDGIKGLYELFRRCEVNIPLLDDIKQVPRYDKFLKELCTVKRKQKLKGCQKVELGEQVSTIIQRKVPTKCKDPGMFSIPFKIGDVQLDTAMLDLGASINVMSYSVYASLKLGPLTETGIVIQMADKSTIFPRGVLEDVLVQVDNLVFPADFYVLDIKNNDLNNVNNGTLTMEFDREVVKFHIFYTLQIPDCESVVNNLDVINNLSQEHKKVVNENKVKKVIARPMENFTTESVRSELQAPKKSKKKKQRPKISTKLRKNRLPPPPQSKFQYDSFMMLSDVEEDSVIT
ncbi:uncharacterized protein [Henckelia pumila]|uniref:uncharacterized protein n=1 Tax=Henckelia pumila TaxID=405737 RepID=UPI003C6E776D